VLHERIKEQRNAKGLSQRELGDLFGITQQAVGRWETGQALPDAPTLGKLADFFNISVDYLLGRDNTISALSRKEEKKPKDLQKLLEQHEIMFDGATLTEEDKQDILNVIELKIYKRSKELNKRKPKNS
jgi:transcriptional regulator with XRE-family HTH domain